MSHLQPDAIQASVAANNAALRLLDPTHRPIEGGDGDTACAARDVREARDIWADRLKARFSA